MKVEHIIRLIAIFFVGMLLVSISDFNKVYSCCPSGMPPFPPPINPPTRPNVPSKIPSLPLRPPPGTGLEPLIFNPPNPSPTAFGAWEVWWIRNRLNYLPFKVPIVWEKKLPDDDRTFAVSQERKKVLDFIAGVLKNDKHALTRAMASLALGKSKDRTILPRLTEALKKDKEFFVQNVVCLALGILDDSSGIDDLKKILFSKDIITTTRAYAALGLGYIKDEVSIEILKQVITSKDKMGNDVICASLLSLGNLKEKSLIPFLGEFLNNSKRHEKERAYAALALGRIGDAEAIPILKKALKGTKDPSIRASIVVAFGLIKSPETKDDLIKLLNKDKTPSVRQFAAISLAQLGDKSVYDPLMKIVNSKKVDFRLRGFVIMALGILGDKKACDTLRKIVVKKEAFGRTAAVVALGLLKDKKSVPELVKILEKEELTDPTSWLYAIQAVGMIGEKEVIPVLEKIYERAQKEISVATNVYNNLTVALTMLGKRQEVLKILHKQLKDESVPPQILLRAIHGTAYVGDKSSIQHLIDFYKDDKNPDLRLYTMLALGFIIDREKINPLYKITADNNYNVWLTIMDHVFTSNPD